MFPTLRLKLILAFALAVFVTVALTGIGSYVSLRDQQEKTERERLALLAIPVSLDVQMLGANRATVDDLRNYLMSAAAELKVRFLLLDEQDRVLVDTQNEMAGRTLDAVAESNRQISPSAQSSFRFASFEDGPSRQVYIIPPKGPAIPATQTQLVQRDYQLVMSVPEEYITEASRKLLPKLGIPALVALAAAGLIAYFLARSISRPVARVTHASEAMAHGHYDQEIEVEGRDEIGRLARSFNTMASQVSRSHQMMRDLLANVAHELKTPLTSIQGFSQALVDGNARTPDDQTQAARIINEEADRMRRLVEDLLYLSQLESGQLRMEMSRVDVGTLLRNAAERVTWQFRDSGRHFRLSIAPDATAVTGDERRLEQVLANLLENAARHTPRDGTISLRAERYGGTVMLAVHNTGSYIPPDVLSRIFERFYRADQVRSRDGRHGGLGLSIAQEIVAAHHGRIEAVSDPETGTEFRVFLPLAPAEVFAAKTAEPTKPRSWSLLRRERGEV